MLKLCLHCIAIVRSTFYISPPMPVKSHVTKEEKGFSIQNDNKIDCEMKILSDCIW